MPDTAPQEQQKADQVDRLLHDAEHAKHGAEFARRMRDTENAEALEAKRARLVAEANALDPDHTVDSWEYADV